MKQKTNAPMVVKSSKSKDSKILYEDERMRIYKEPFLGQVIIEDVRSGVTMCFMQYRAGGGLEFVTNGKVEPFQVNGVLGWEVGSRKQVHHDAAAWGAGTFHGMSDG